jgi:hypothetical protein
MREREREREKRERERERESYGGKERDYRALFPIRSHG